LLNLPKSVSGSANFCGGLDPLDGCDAYRGPFGKFGLVDAYDRPREVHAEEPPRNSVSQLVGLVAARNPDEGLE